MLRFGLILAGAVLALDQLTKWLILEVAKLSPLGCLEAGPRPLRSTCEAIEISSVMDFSMVWNFGVSFGLLQAGSDLARYGLVALSAGISLFFLWWLKDASRRLTAISLGLVIGGALGNLIDRVRFGAVADFIDFSGPWFGWRIGDFPVGFPYVFNVADAAITVGAAMLLLDFLLHGEGEGRKAPANPPPAGGRDA
jgi:signal peptidase II